MTGGIVKFDLKEFMRQVDEMQLDADETGVNASAEDWFAAHPFSPIRVKALQLF